MGNQEFTDSKYNNIVLRDIHCPYCNSDSALLLSRVSSRRFSIQLPAFGLKFILSLLYLAIVQIWIYGYKIIETTRHMEYVTYGFCPHCGNSYSMAAPETIKAETEAPKLYRVREGKAIMGLCRGISEYTGISLLWIRIMTTLYGVTVIGAILYFLIGACIPFREDVEDGSSDKRLYRIRTGKDVTGLCKGFAEYTGIPVMWVRLFMVLLGATVIGAILYFIVSAFVPVREDVEQGIEKKKLYKVKKKKLVLGLCAGIAEYTGKPLWLVRLLTVVLILPTVLYFIIGAIVPTKEEKDDAQ